MRVLSREKLTIAAKRHADARLWIDAWRNVANKAQWQSLHDVRATYQSTDQVDCCLVFNARGNKYRLICRVHYATPQTQGTLLVKHFVTHAEYDKGQWRKDCK